MTRNLKRESYMNKRVIVFGSLLTVFLLLMIPNISALRYRTVQNNIETTFTKLYSKNNNNIKIDAMQSHIHSLLKRPTNFLRFIYLILSIYFGIITILSIYVMVVGIQTGTTIEFLAGLFDFFLCGYLSIKLYMKFLESKQCLIN